MTSDVSATPPAAVVVLGMARSGTSAITRLLSLLGVELGPQEALLAPIAGENAKGFFEHRPLMRVNKELLQRMGGSWSEPPRLRAGWQRDAGLDDLRERARESIAADFARARVWGFKDPRTSLTLPFWEELLGRASYVICHRGPLDCARSLERRNGIRLDDGVALWARYTASALAHTAGRRRVLVSYEELFGAGAALIDELAAFVGVRPSEDSRAAAAAWIEPELRHHAGTLRELAEHPAVSAHARALHLLLRLASGARARGELDDSLQEALDGMAGMLLRDDAAQASLAPARGASPLTARGVDQPASGERERHARIEPAAEGPRASVVVVLGDDPWASMACLESIAELEVSSPPMRSCWWTTPRLACAPHWTRWGTVCG